MHCIKTVRRNAELAFPSCKYRYCSKESFLSSRRTSRLRFNPDRWSAINWGSLTANSLCRFFSFSFVWRGSCRKSSKRSCVSGATPNSSANKVLRYSSTAKDSSTSTDTVSFQLSLASLLSIILVRLTFFRVSAPLLNASADSKSHFGFAEFVVPGFNSALFAVLSYVLFFHCASRF